MEEQGAEDVVGLLKQHEVEIEEEAHTEISPSTSGVQAQSGNQDGQTPLARRVTSVSGESPPKFESQLSASCLN